MHTTTFCALFIVDIFLPPSWRVSWSHGDPMNEWMDGRKEGHSHNPKKVGCKKKHTYTHTHISTTIRICQALQWKARAWNHACKTAKAKTPIGKRRGLSLSIASKATSSSSNGRSSSIEITQLWQHRLI